MSRSSPAYICGEILTTASMIFRAEAAWRSLGVTSRHSTAEGDIENDQGRLGPQRGNPGQSTSSTAGKAAMSAIAMAALENGSAFRCPQDDAHCNTTYSACRRETSASSGRRTWPAGSP